jgi:hypothetical protein
MGDQTTETVELQSRRDDEEYAREQGPGFVDCFVSQCRGNKSIEEVKLSPYAFNGHDDDASDKVGQAIGNLQSLKALHIYSSSYHGEGDSSSSDDNEVVAAVRIPDCEILERILRHVRQSVALVIDDERLRTIEEVQPFARAIRGHPTITSFEDSGRFRILGYFVFYLDNATGYGIYRTWRSRSNSSR